MKWLLLATTLVVLLSLGAGCNALRSRARTPASAASQPSRSSRFRMHELANGMKVIVRETPGTGVATADVWLNVGSANEAAEIEGISHFLEHMMFKGTERRPTGQMDEVVEGIGGVLNAGTSKDFTHYYMTVPSSNIDVAIDALGDALTSSTLQSAELEKERGVILEEISRKEDNPFGTLYEKLYEVAFSKSPYRHSVLGETQVISGITREQMWGYYRHFYTPARMALIVAGDVRAEDIVRKAQDAFGQESASGNARNGLPGSQWNAGQNVVIEKDVKEVYSATAFPAPGILDVDKVIAADVLQAILSDGRSSRLNRELKEKRGLVSSIGASYPTHRAQSLFAIFATMQPANLEEYRKALDQELDRARQHKPADEVLERAKRQLVNSYYFSQETSGGAASLTGYYYTLTGSLAFEQHYVERVQAVTAEQVRDCAKELFVPEQAVRVTLVPPAASDGGR